MVAFLSVLGKHFFMTRYKAFEDDPKKVLTSGIYQVSALVTGGQASELSIFDIRRLFREKFGPNVSVLFFGISKGTMWIQFSVDPYNQSQFSRMANPIAFLALTAVAIFAAIKLIHDIITDPPKAAHLIPQPPGTPDSIGGALGQFIGQVQGTAITATVQSAGLTLIPVALIVLAFLFFTRNRG